MSGVMYEIGISHHGLNKYRHIRGRDKLVVKRKAAAQCDTWDLQWTKKCEKEEERLTREHARLEKEAKSNEAVRQSEEAEAEQAALHNVLFHTLDIDDRVDWSSLKDCSAYEIKELRPPKKPTSPPQPWGDDPQYAPKLNILHYLIPSLRRKRQEEASAIFSNAKATWEIGVKRLHGLYEKNMESFKDDQMAWQALKSEFIESQKDQHRSIEEQERRYLEGDPDSIEEHADLVLSASEYADYFPKRFEVQYKPDARLFVVNYLLPNPEQLPVLKRVKYVQSRDAFDKSQISEAQSKRNYNDVCYQICLRTIHELFEADVVKALDTIVFNGIVEFVDRATGRESTSCILSISTTKEKFLEIDLRLVEPKACFRALKGICSTKLHGLVPVAPIVQLETDDSRIVQHIDVGQGINSETNLAAMDWEEFEHLVRELFENEFAVNGGEVKVTQASRDGGVDALAFDPDPIRGGKIVIQAKRYTNTVGVAAVRDLYGTVMNEGATKGILVTTSSYGPDAYEFAKGKPITLLDGGNLLHLLEKHGYQARINLAEAKELRKDD
jgi:restriction system protein